MTTLILSVICSISASAYDVEVDGIYYDIYYGTASVTQCKNYSADIVIPESITIGNLKYSVTSIGAWAFAYCRSLTSVTIPNSVTGIGFAAFYECSSLTSVTIPNSVTSIGDYAFSNCSGLTSVTISNSLKSIGTEVFRGCSSLTSVTIPNSVKSIGYRAFYECYSLISVTIPNSVTSIGEEAFYDCFDLTSVTIPNSVTNIGDCAFNGCSGLTSVTIPNSVTSIGGSAFYLCKGLTSVTIPNSVTSIGEKAFRYCSDLRSVTIPNSVTSIGESVFYGCSGLTSITIPNSVTYIYSEAFAKCSNLENVYCYAEEFSGLSDNIFKDSYIEYATLHVPSSALSYYQTTEPWSGFGTIQTLEGTGAETKKCETPTISFADGKLTFSCATEEVEYVSEITCSDVSKYYSNEINLTACYDISVTAMKSGLGESDVATAKLYWLTSSGSHDETSINNVSMRGIAIQSDCGFITISGLDNNETVSFYATDGKNLGTAKSIDGNVSFQAKQGTIILARIGKESVKIAVK